MVASSPCRRDVSGAVDPSDERIGPAELGAERVPVAGRRLPELHRRLTTEAREPTTRRGFERHTAQIRRTRVETVGGLTGEHERCRQRRRVAGA